MKPVDFTLDVLVTSKDHDGFIQGREEVTLRIPATFGERPTITHHPAEHVTL